MLTRAYLIASFRIPNSRACGASSGLRNGGFQGVLYNDFSRIEKHVRHLNYLNSRKPESCLILIRHTRDAFDAWSPTAPQVYA